MRLKLHPEAEEEIFQDAAWYDEQRTGLGDEFLQHVDRWFGVILETPRVWPLWPGAPPNPVAPIRRVVLDRFPHSIAYQVFATHVLVLAVAHDSRRPFYWRNRTSD